MRKLIFVVAILVLITSLGLTSSPSSASSDTCTPCRQQCQNEGAERQLDCLVDPSETFESCKTKYFQYVNSCYSVFCNYGGLCQPILD